MDRILRREVAAPAQTGVLDALQEVGDGLGTAARVADDEFGRGVGVVEAGDGGSGAFSRAGAFGRAGQDEDEEEEGDECAAEEG